MRSLVLLLALLGCSSAPLLTPAAPPVVSLAPCPTGLAQLGLTSPPVSQDIYARHWFDIDSTIVLFDQGPVRFNRVQGVNTVSALMEVAGVPPTQLGPLQLNIWVTSPAPRTYAQRQLTIERDSEESTVVNPSVTSAVPDLSRSGAVVERIIYLVPPEVALAAMRRPTVGGALGATQLRLADRERDGIRALLLFVMCGPAWVELRQRHN